MTLHPLKSSFLTTTQFPTSPLDTEIIHPARSANPAPSVSGLPIVSPEFLRSGALRTVAALSLSAVGLLTLAASPRTLAQATTAPVPAESAVKKPAAKETDEKGVQKLTEFVVSADKPYTDRNVDIPRTIDDVQPYYIFKSETIEEINSVDVNTFLKEQRSMNTASSESSIVQPVAGDIDGTRTSDIERCVRCHSAARAEPPAASHQHRDFQSAHGQLVAAFAAKIDQSSPAETINIQRRTSMPLLKSDGAKTHYFYLKNSWILISKLIF